MNEVLAVAVVLALAVVAIRIAIWRRRPTAVARARLHAQLAETRRTLQPQGDGTGTVAAEEQLLRQKWFNEQLTSTPVEALKPPGIGASAHETLRSHGVTSAGEVPRIAGMQIRSLGGRKKELLLHAFRQLRDRLDAEAKQFSWEEIDRMNGGRLSHLKAAAERRARDRLRDVEALEIRRGEIERRIAQLNGRGG